MTTHTQISIRGFLVGTIWMPAAECWKELNYDATNQESRWSEKGTLRDHILAATNDGDFQSCAIAHGEIIVIRTNGRRRTIRTFDLARFPSVADCLHDDPDWFPDFGDDE